jgi:hypothetical protein
VQTFLPYFEYHRSARVLDDKRLAKQLVECQQIMQVLVGVDKNLEPRKAGGWSNHPAVTMWRGYEDNLSLYATAIAYELDRRPKKDGTKRSTNSWSALDNVYQHGFNMGILSGYEGEPPWLGDTRLHYSHRLALLMKAPAWYSPLLHDDVRWGLPSAGWPTPPKDGYIYWWPDRGWGKPTSVLP